MAKSISVKRKIRGRPATGTEPLYGVRIGDKLMAEIMRWAKSHDASRSEAIRQLVEKALNSEVPPKKPIARPGRRTRAKELARDAIEKMGDPTASPEERDQRRRRLTKGPLEFREDRVDLPKTKRK